MRIAIKLGTSTVTGTDGLPDRARLSAYARVLRDRGHAAVLVSSGAVAAGRARRPDVLPGRNVPHTQMLSALGNRF